MRIVTLALGAAFTLQGLGWIVAPARAAESLGRSATSPLSS
jgi:hypothetical protein